jgi:hypothetical protein
VAFTTERKGGSSIRAILLVLLLAAQLSWHRVLLLLRRLVPDLLS